MTIGYVTNLNLTNSLQRFLRERTGIRTDLIYDGYTFFNERPLVTIEQMQGNNEYNVKRREVVEVTYRWQIGLHAENFNQKMRLQDEINELMMFSKIPYYDFNKSADNPAGFFRVEVSAVTPMPSDDITKESRRHTVYFDTEITTIKRRYI